MEKDRRGKKDRPRDRSRGRSKEKDRYRSNRSDATDYDIDSLTTNDGDCAHAFSDDSDHGVEELPQTSSGRRGGATKKNKQKKDKGGMDKLEVPTTRRGGGQLSRRGSKSAPINVTSSEDEMYDQDFNYGQRSLEACSDFEGFASHVSSTGPASNKSMDDLADYAEEENLVIDDSGGRGDADGARGRHEKKPSSAISLRDTSVGGDDVAEQEMAAAAARRRRNDDTSSFSGADTLSSMAQLAANFLDNYLTENPHVQSATVHMDSPPPAPGSHGNDQIVEINSNSTTPTQREKRALRNTKVQLYLSSKYLLQQQQQNLLAPSTPYTQPHRCSTESTSEFPVSSPSNPQPPGGNRYTQHRTPLLKNTLPNSDSFERHLAEISAENPQMSINEKMQAWHCDDELSDVEDVNSFDDAFKRREEYKRKATGRTRRGAAPENAAKAAKDNKDTPKTPKEIALLDANANDTRNDDIRNEATHLLFPYDFAEFLSAQRMQAREVRPERPTTLHIAGQIAAPADREHDNRPSTSAAAQLATQRRRHGGGGGGGGGSADADAATRKRVQKNLTVPVVGVVRRSQQQQQQQQHSTTPPVTSSSDNDVECYPPGPKKVYRAVPPPPPATAGRKNKAKTPASATPKSSPLKLHVYEEVLCPSDSEETSLEQSPSDVMMASAAPSPSPLAAAVAAEAKARKGKKDKKSKADNEKTPKPRTRGANPTDEDSDFRLHRKNREIDKTDDRDASPGNGGGLIQMRLDFLEDKQDLNLNEKRNELFKTPTVPQKYLQTHSQRQQSDQSDSHNNNYNSAMEDDYPPPHYSQATSSSPEGGAAFHQQHEFCNYLGLTGLSTANAVANALAELDKCNLARRSLRVRQLQHQERNEKKDKKERKVRQDKKEKNSSEEENGKVLEALKLKQLRELKRREKGDAEMLSLVVETTDKASSYETEGTTTQHASKRRRSSPAAITASPTRRTTATLADAQHNGCIATRQSPSLPQSSPPTSHADKLPPQQQQPKEPEIKILCHIAAKNAAEAEKASKKAVKQITAPIRQTLMRHLKRSGGDDSTALGVVTIDSSSSNGGDTSPSTCPHSSALSDAEIDFEAEVASSPPSAKRQAMREYMAAAMPMVNKRSHQATQRKKREVQNSAAPSSPPLMHNTRPAAVVAAPVPLLDQFQEYLKESRQTKPSIFIVQSLTSGESINAPVTSNATASTMTKKPLFMPPNKTPKAKVSPLLPPPPPKQLINKNQKIQKHNLRNPFSGSRKTTKRRLHKLLTRSALNMSQQRQLRSRRIVLLKRSSTISTRKTAIKSATKDKSVPQKVAATTTLTPTSVEKPFTTRPVREHSKCLTPATTQREHYSRNCRGENKVVTVASDAAPPPKMQLESMSPPLVVLKEIALRRRQSPQVRLINYCGPSTRPKLMPPPTTDESDLNSKATATTITIVKKSATSAAAAAADTLSEKVVAKAQQNAGGDSSSTTIIDPDAVVVSSTTNSYDETALLNINNSALLLPSNTKELHKNISFVVDSGGSSSRRSTAASRSIETKDSSTQSLNTSTVVGASGGRSIGIHYLANAPSAASSLQNPLKSEHGRVLHVYYEMEVLIAVQEALVSFWKHSKLINVLAAQQLLQQQQQKSHVAAQPSVRLSEPSSSDHAAGAWVHLGECRHLENDIEINTPYANRICIHNSIPIYVEMRCRELPQEHRECNLLSMYINIYYYHDEDMHAKLHSIQLDSVQSVPRSVIFTTITESRYFVMSWPQENILGKIRSGLCKYSLTPHLDTLASIREFKSIRHEIRYLECTDDDKLLGFGASQLTIWDHRSGDVLMNYDLDLNLGRNMGSIYYPSLEIGQPNVLLLFQYIQQQQPPHNSDDIESAELVVIACSISHAVPTHRILQRHRLPAPAFNDIVSAVNTGEHLLLTARNDEEIWISCVDPNMLTCVPAQHSQRFYARGSTQLIELTAHALTVDSFANHVLKLAAGGRSVRMNM